MKILKETIRKVSVSDSICSIKETLRDFVERSNEELEDFYGKLDELILAQAVKVLRKRRVCIMPEAVEESANLVGLVKSLKEVRKDDKDVLCRAENSGK